MPADFNAYPPEAQAFILEAARARIEDRREQARAALELDRAESARQDALTEAAARQSRTGMIATTIVDIALTVGAVATAVFTGDAGASATMVGGLVAVNIVSPIVDAVKRRKK